MNPIAKITPDMIESLYGSFGYKWHPDFNITWIRATDRTPNIYNDFCFVTHEGNKKIELFSATTDAGNDYLEFPMNKKGTLIVKPGQYLDSHIIGYHQGNKAHEAFVQRGNILVYRDNNKDTVLDYTETLEEGKNFGQNWHGGKRKGETLRVGKNSAGCFGWPFWDYKDMVITLGKESGRKKFDLTLFEERELIEKGHNPIMAKLASIRLGYAVVEAVKRKMNNN